MRSAIFLERQHVIANWKSSAALFLGSLSSLGPAGQPCPLYRPLASHPPSAFGRG